MKFLSADVHAGHLTLEQAWHNLSTQFMVGVPPAADLAAMQERTRYNLTHKHNDKERLRKRRARARGANYEPTPQQDYQASGGNAAYTSKDYSLPEIDIDSIDLSKLRAGTPESWAAAREVAKRLEAEEGDNSSLFDDEGEPPGVLNASADHDGFAPEGRGMPDPDTGGNGDPDMGRSGPHAVRGAPRAEGAPIAPLPPALAHTYAALAASIDPATRAAIDRQVRAEAGAHHPTKKETP